MARNSVFEVQTYQGNHWVLDSRFEDEPAARAHGFRPLFDRLAASEEPEERGFLACVVL